MAGSSSNGEGTSTPVADATTSCPAPNAEKRAQTAADAKQNESGENETEEGAAAQTSCEEEKSETSASTSAGAPSNSAEPLASDDGTIHAGKQEVSSEEKGRIPYQHTERVSEPMGGTVERNDNYEREHYNGAASDVERLLEKMAERAACVQLEMSAFGNLTMWHRVSHMGIFMLVYPFASIESQMWMKNW